MWLNSGHQATVGSQEVSRRMEPSPTAINHRHTLWDYKRGKQTQTLNLKMFHILKRRRDRLLVAPEQHFGDVGFVNCLLLKETREEFITGGEVTFSKSFPWNDCVDVTRQIKVVACIQRKTRWWQCSSLFFRASYSWSVQLHSSIHIPPITIEIFIKKLRIASVMQRIYRQQLCWIICLGLMP